MLPDYPIKTRTEDLLGRVPLADKIASLILEFPGDESFVVGIDGAWGSGKTSFVNLILEQLRSADDRLSIIEFNPWNFSGQGELIEDFFDSLSVAIKENESGSQKIKEYAAKLIKKSEFSFEPELSFFGAIKVSAGKLRRLGGEKTLQESRKAVDNLLKHTGKRIVIAVDDTDRLDAQETKLIFKLVKMTANFPNTVFILAYDREKVAQKVSEKGLPGEEYLEKIVQVNFRLPQPDKQDFHRILFRDIDQSIEDMDEKWNADRWSSLFRGGLRSFFKTIRDVKRYVSSLRLDLSIVGKDEVNPVDFLGIEAIRVFAPDIYTTVGNNKDLFTEKQSQYFGSGSEGERKARVKEIDDIVESYEDEPQRESLKGIIRELFPQVDGLYRNTHYGPDWQVEWQKNLQVASPDIFGRYFQFSTPVGTMSEGAMKVLMSTLTQVEAFVDNLKKVDEEGKLRNALTRAMDYLGELDANQKQNLVTALMRFGNTVKVERLGIFDLEDADTLMARLIYHTIKSLPQDRRVDYLKKALEETKCTFTGTYVVSYLSHEYKEYEEKKSTQEPLLTKMDLSILEPFCVELFKAAGKQGTLLTTKNLPHVLFRWEEWGSKGDVRAFIKKNIESKKGLVTLLSAFVSRVLSSAGDYNNIHKKSLGELYDIRELETRVAGISEEDLQAMSEAEKEAVALFRSPPNNHFD